MAKKSDPNQLVLALDFPPVAEPSKQPATMLVDDNASAEIATGTTDIVPIVAPSSNGPAVNLNFLAEGEILGPIAQKGEDEKSAGELEAEELRRQNSRALKYEDRAEASIKSFMLFAVIAFLIKIGVPISNAVTSHYDLPPMDGTLVSGALAIVCIFHFVNAVRYALWAREHSYQRELKFVQLSWLGKAATILDRASAGALMLLFGVVMLLTIPDIAATVAYLWDQYFFFVPWRNGTTVVPSR